MRITAVVACVVLAACASTSSTTSTSGTMGAAVTTQTISAGGIGGTAAVTMVNDNRTVKTDLSVPMAEAWPRLLAAYDAVGIKVSEVSEPTKTVGNPGLRARRRLGDIQLRLALNCGGDNSNPNAETYDLTLTVRSVLTPVSGGVQLDTYIRGTGVNALTNNTNYVQCYSLGLIEKRIADLVRTGTVPRKP
jgi:hypothetical protein